MKFIVLLALLTTCKTLPPKPDGQPTCADACDRMRALNCETAKPTPEGKTCEQVCENAQASGVIRLDLRCMTGALSCDAADSCAAPPPGP